MKQAFEIFQLNPAYMIGKHIWTDFLGGIDHKESPSGILIHKTIKKLAELEVELQRTTEELQNTNEVMQTLHEELKSINEKLQSSNEELQSANKELTTSREEMQSMNKVLQTVNSELQAKIGEFLQTDIDRPFTKLVSTLFYPTEYTTIKFRVG